MKKVLTAICFSLMASTVSFAAPSCDDLSIPGASAEQIISLKSQCLKAQNLADPTQIAKNVSEYAEIGQKYGVAISEVAKSLGTTANELAKTPLGLFVILVVGWKLVGQDLLGVVGGTVWFLVMLPLWFYLLDRLLLRRLYNFEEKFSEDGKRISKKRTPVDWTGEDATVLFCLSVFILLICAAGFIMVF